jgi:hypothetical protein
MSRGSTSMTSRLSGPAPKCATGSRARTDENLGQGLLVRLAGGCFLQRLAVFHEARRHGPVPAARLDRPSAQQDAPLVLGHAADHETRVLVVNRAASLADVAWQVIALGDAQLYFGAAFAAEVHGVPAGYGALLQLVDAAEGRTPYWSPT